MDEEDHADGDAQQADDDQPHALAPGEPAQPGSLST
jgi:hypothetical protein